MKVVETDRLILRRLTSEDADFIYKLLNNPSWLQFIGDKGVRTLDDARDYILKGPVAMYEQLGFGMYLTQLKEEGTPIGICGLIKRDWLKEADVGYAFLPEFWGNGYAYEASSAVIAHGKNVIGLKCILGITSMDNERSIRLLEKLGMQGEGTVQSPGSDEELKKYASYVE
ncbi:GNAT family N-acetyltransferase [Paenibacillus sp. SC116]|uniref:GNAT family N-acetyltransferase n=1 Tax=Paenibacillus sp. SC116 TaxID=2968986 RepID=UPI00215A649E|nr:GNAT family N-acetyltransferase [Paenibacillus sp. SC116]MCR8844964.1 GNAT family N-acetyltransferase [Paenibacillus sp. SC116]